MDATKKVTNHFAFSSLRIVSFILNVKKTENTPATTLGNLAAYKRRLDEDEKRDTIFMQMTLKIPGSHV